jgi:hypothetical protein
MRQCFRGEQRAAGSLVMHECRSVLPASACRGCEKAAAELDFVGHALWVLEKGSACLRLCLLTWCARSCMWQLARGGCLAGECAPRAQALLISMRRAWGCLSTAHDAMEARQQAALRMQQLYERLQPAGAAAAAAPALPTSPVTTSAVVAVAPQPMPSGEHHSECTAEEPQAASNDGSCAALQSEPYQPPSQPSLDPVTPMPMDIVHG